MLRGGEGVLGGPEGLLPLRGVAEDEEVRRERFLLGRVERRTGKLLDLEIEVLPPLAGARRPGRRLFRLPAEGGEPAEPQAHLRRLLAGPREIVQRRKRRRPRQQSGNAVLPHQLHEERRQVREGGLGGHPPVEVGPAAPRGGDDSPEHQLLLPREPRLLPRLREVRPPGEVEARRDLRLLLPRLHGHRIGLLAQRKADRLDQDRFARPCLPRHDVQARGERHAHVAEDGEIAYGKFDQHRGSRITAPPT